VAVARAPRARTRAVVASELATFATLLKRYRMAAGLTQEELAERANLSVRGVSNLERGVRHLPQHTTIELLAEALQLAGPDRATRAQRPSPHEMPVPPGQHPAPVGGPCTGARRAGAPPGGRGSAGAGAGRRTGHRQVAAALRGDPAGRGQRVDRAAGGLSAA